MALVISSSSSKTHLELSSSYSNWIANIGCEEKFRAFQGEVASLHHRNIALCKCKTTGYPNFQSSGLGFYIYLLASLVGF